jgi:hypothetical protein
MAFIFQIPEKPSAWSQSESYTNKIPKLLSPALLFAAPLHLSANALQIAGISQSPHLPNPSCLTVCGKNKSKYMVYIYYTYLYLYIIMVINCNKEGTG